MAAFALIIITGVKTCTVFEPWRSKEYLAGKQKRHANVYQYECQTDMPMFFILTDEQFMWIGRAKGITSRENMERRTANTLAPPGCNAPSRENVPEFLYIAEFTACLFILLERDASEHDARNCPQLGMELPFHRLVRYLYNKVKSGCSRSIFIPLADWHAFLVVLGLAQ